MECAFDIRHCSRIYLGAVPEILPQVLPAGRVVVVSDTEADRLHGGLPVACETVLIGRGERIKTLSTVENIHRRLIAAGADRKTFILGVGGGIVTDIAGFAASTYMRGVPFGFVPTTLLGQVDAAVGGKNGVNIDGYKNMAGTFAQPQFVVCDPALLRTLPDREFRAGLAEAVKAGIIADEELFAAIEEADFGELRSDQALLRRVVGRAVGVKVAVVARDEREAGERRKLNLGHTLAHAIERTSGRMNHGEAVAVGTVLMARAAVRLGMLAETECRRIAGALGRLGFRLTPPVSMDRMLEAVAADKKREGGTLHVVLPTGIGSCTVCDMPLGEFRALMGAVGAGAAHEGAEREDCVRGLPADVRAEAVAGDAAQQDASMPVGAEARPAAVSVSDSGRSDGSVAVIAADSAACASDRGIYVPGGATLCGAVRAVLGSAVGAEARPAAVSDFRCGPSDACGRENPVPDPIVRPLRKGEEPLLTEFLYEAIWRGAGQPPVPRTVLQQPALWRYVAGFGSRPDDRCLVAEAGGCVVGAVWVRCIRGFGYIADGVPECALAVYDGYRGRGIGTALLRGMLRRLRCERYDRISLSVQKANPAVNLYRREGFSVVAETDEEYVMVCPLR